MFVPPGRSVSTLPPVSAAAPLVRVGIASIAVGALAWGWDLLAHQVPSSPFHLHGYPGAIDRLGTHAWIEAALIFALAPRAAERGFANDSRGARLASLTAATGTLLAFASMTVSARTGVLANQLADTTSFASLLLAARLAGDALLLVALVLTVRAALRSPPPPGSPG